MEDTLGLALGITGIGMTLLFLVLGLFYGLLALLTRVVRDRDAAAAATADVAAVAGLPVRKQDAGAANLRAAVVAVALARAEAESGAGAARDWDHGETGTADRWWALHHGRRLAAPPSPWRGR